MSIINNNLLLAGTDEGYNLTRSLRFRSSASAYLSRTPATNSGSQIFTFRTLVKRGALGSAGQFLYFAGTNSPAGTLVTEISFTNDNLKIFSGLFGSTTDIDLVTSQVFRDPASFYDVCVAIDTTQATASNRVKIYVNGSQITAFSTATYPSLNYTTAINNTYIQNIGRRQTDGYFDGYLTETIMVSGQALTPSSFGETDTITGVWKPKRYAGTYGTNGFYLPFTDNSALTTSSNAGLGKDFSGNGNYWTTNNISITSGTTYDSMTDVPTLTSATAANFCVVNPLDKQTDIVVAQGNLQISTSAGAGNKQIRGSIALPSTGKFYWETKNTGSVNNFNMGLTTTTASLSTEGAGDVFYNEGGTIGNNGTNTSGFSTLALNDVVGVAVDVDANKIYFYKNNTLVNSGGTTINISAPFAPMFGLYDNGNAQSITFGQRPFAYTPPTGYVALNTYNLPTPTILQGNTVMDATLYTGNSSTQTITNAAGFKPDFVWAKSRSNGYGHKLFDSVRGVYKQLNSNNTDAESTDVNMLTAFNSNGFSLGNDTGINGSGATFVGWQWQAGQGTTSSNTSGTITSTVSVNASAGFSIVTYTGTGANATVGHGLGVAPSLIIVKARNQAYNWNVYSASLANTQFLRLNTTDSVQAGPTLWNSTSPTSSVFSLGTSLGVNGSGDTHVAYCFAPIAGYSAFGSYTGNGSSDGTFVYTGFRPKFLMIKSSTYSGADSNWNIIDTSRNPYNVSTAYLNADQSAAEGSYAGWDLLSNGFKLRATGGSLNSSGQTYIYMAFAEVPTKFALAR